MDRNLLCGVLRDEARDHHHGLIMTLEVDEVDSGGSYIRKPYSNKLRTISGYTLLTYLEYTRVLECLTI